VVVGACAPLFVCSQFYRVANAVVAPSLQRDLALGSEALGALSAAFFYAFAAAQLPLALVLDRFGARVCMTALSLLGAGGALVFAGAESRAVATLGEVLVGIGMAGNLVGSLKLMGQWFPAKEFATVAGGFAAVGTLGNVLATTPLVILVGELGWRRAFVVIAAGTAALAVAFFALVRERAPEASSAAQPPVPVAAMLRDLLSRSDYWIISFGAFCRYGAFVSIQALWAGPYLVEVVGLSPVGAANALLLLNLGFVAGAPLGGWLSDRVLGSRKKLVLVALAATGGAEVALALAGAAPPPALVVAVLAALGLTSAFGQVVWPHIRGLVPGRMAGMAMSGVNFFNILGAAAFLHGTGWVLERWAVPGGLRGPDGFRAAFLASAALLGLALGLYALTRDVRVDRGPAAQRDPRLR
jgi:nitrate/nitrite transporter NarK